MSALVEGFLVGLRIERSDSHEAAAQGRSPRPRSGRGINFRSDWQSGIWVYDAVACHRLNLGMALCELVSLGGPLSHGSLRPARAISRIPVETPGCAASSIR